MLHYDNNLEQSREALLETIAYLDRDKPIYVKIDGQQRMIGNDDIETLKKELVNIDYIPVISTFIDDMRFALDEQRKMNKD